MIDAQNTWQKKIDLLSEKKPTHAEDLRIRSACLGIKITFAVA